VYDNTSSNSDAAATNVAGERRRCEELSPDIVALIASCGEKVRRTDSVDVPNRAEDRTAAPVKQSS
jgi:hypothetical protein